MCQQKTVILAAGLGRRMRELGEQKPKCLILINGKPILFYQIDNLLRFGIKDITVVVGYKMEQIENEIRKTDRFSSIRCLFNPFYFFTDSIVSLWVYLNYRSLDGSLIILSGDRVLRTNVYNNIINSTESSLVVLRQDCTGVFKDSLVLSKDEKRIVSIGGNSSYLSGGIACISEKDFPLFFSIIERILTSKNGFNKWWLEGIAGLIKKGKIVKPIIFPSDVCLNVNKPEDINSSLAADILKEEV